MLFDDAGVINTTQSETVEGIGVLPVSNSTLTVVEDTVLGGDVGDEENSPDNSMNTDVDEVTVIHQRIKDRVEIVETKIIPIKLTDATMSLLSELDFEEDGNDKQDDTVVRNDVFLDSFNISLDEERTAASYVELLKAYNEIFGKWKTSGEELQKMKQNIIETEAKCATLQKDNIYLRNENTVLKNKMKVKKLEQHEASSTSSEDCTCCRFTVRCCEKLQDQIAQLENIVRNEKPADPSLKEPTLSPDETLSPISCSSSAEIPIADDISIDKIREGNSVS